MGSVTAYTTNGGKRYRVRYRTPDRRQTDKRGFTSKREAEQFLAGVEVSKGRGEWVDPTLSRISVAAWSETWIAAHSNLKPSTRSAYEWIVIKYVLPKWANAPLVAVAHTDVQAWVTKLSDSLAASSVRKIHVVFSGLMKYAVHDRRIPRNPCDGIRLPRVGASARGYLTPDKVDELAALCDPDSDLIYLLADTGLRWGEVAALKVRRIDFGRRRLDIAEAVTEPEGEIIWGTPKNHERRSVPFPAFLADVLTARTAGKSPDDLVFISAKGEVLRNGNFRRRRFDAAVKQLEVLYPAPEDHAPLAATHRRVLDNFRRSNGTFSAANAGPHVRRDDPRRIQRLVR